MLMQTYAKFPVKFISGNHATLTDDNGKKYIDFTSGIGVNSIGYNHPKWVSAVTNQAQKLAHTSNLFHSEPCEKLAAKLVEISGLSNVFFSNSGAEANEAMIKLARKYKPNKKIITLKQSFHGRTVLTLEATGQDKFHENFAPFTGGFDYMSVGEFPKEDIAGIIIELIQGEGGVLPLEKEYVQKLYNKCKENDWLFMVDEVQTGIARTGKWFCYQNYDILPDIISFAKGIGGGLPIGGIISGEKCKDTFQYNDHGSTFGGNPIACSAALSVLEVLENELENINKKGEFLKKALIKAFGNARGIGLMLGATVQGNPKEIAQKYLEKGLAVLTAGADSIRLLPPLTISQEELEKGAEMLCNIS